jgi:hypothetical protein
MFIAVPSVGLRQAAVATPGAKRAVAIREAIKRRMGVTPGQRKQSFQDRRIDKTCEVKPVFLRFANKFLRRRHFSA